MCDRWLQIHYTFIIRMFFIVVACFDMSHQMVISWICLKDNSVIFPLGVFPINVAVVTLWLVLTLHSPRLLKRFKETKVLRIYQSKLEPPTAFQNNFLRESFQTLVK